MFLQRMAVLVALILVSASAAADWKRDYDRGRKAYQDGDWVEAEARFRDAFRDEGEASHRKRFEGMRFDEYMPQFYAGMAAYRQGRCDAALNYWADRSMQKVFERELPDLKAQWQRGKQECDTRLAAASQPATTTPATGTPSTSTSSGTGTPPKQPATSTTTSTASTTTPSNTPPRPITTPPPTPRPADPRPAAISAPGLLRQAADLYFAGRYADLVKVEAQSLADGRARAHTLMLRAAASFSLAEQNGDQGILDDARRDVRAARAAQASLAPDRAAFSPKFVQFWSSTR